MPPPQMKPCIGCCKYFVMSKNGYLFNLFWGSGCKVRQGLTSGDVCEREYSLFFCLCVVSRTGLYFLFPAVFLLPLVCPPVSPFPRSLSLLLGGFFSVPIQLVCLSLLQKHEHIVEMCGACNSEQVRMREGGEGSVGFQLHVQIHGVLNADCGLS